MTDGEDKSIDNAGAESQQEPPKRRSFSIFRFLIKIVVVLVLLYVGFCLLYYFVTGEPIGRPLPAPLTSPKTVYDEIIDVPAGKYLPKGFFLRGRYKVNVEIQVIQGSAINVYLMTSEQWAVWQQALKNPIGKRLKFLPELSNHSVRQYSREAVLNKGDYNLVFKQDLLQSSKPSTVKFKLVLKP